jgi:hypothetical protein
MTDHRWFKCEQPCEKQHCVYCEGGLAFCVVCKKGEAELEPTCPGRPDEQPHAWDDLKEELERVRRA